MQKRKILGQSYRVWPPQPPLWPPPTTTTTTMWLLPLRDSPPTPICSRVIICPFLSLVGTIGQILRVSFLPSPIVITLLHHVMCLICIDSTPFVIHHTIRCWMSRRSSIAKSSVLYAVILLCWPSHLTNAFKRKKSFKTSCTRRWAVKTRCNSTQNPPLYTCLTWWLTSDSKFWATIFSTWKQNRNAKKTTS